MLTLLCNDLARSLRLLGRSPAFAVIAVLTVGLGMGATTTAFSLANWALLRPVPGVVRPQDVRVVWTGIRESVTRFQPRRVSYPNLMDVTPRLETISLGAYQRGAHAVATTAQEPRPVRTDFVTASYFQVLGIRCSVGRTFTAQEDDPGSPMLVAVISDDLWASVFGRDPQVLGRPLIVDSQAFTVIGVVSSAFRGTERINTTDLWLPGATYPVLNLTSAPYTDRTSGGYFEFVARLTAGASWQSAEAELQALSQWLAREYPRDNEKFRTAGFHFLGPIGPHPLHDRLRPVMWLMLALNGLVLLVASANVGNLLVIRGLRRRDEIVVRRALGATRGRLVCQQIMEGIVIWFAGGLVGLLLALLVLRSVSGLNFLGTVLPVASAPIDWRVVAFTLGLSVAVGLLFCVTPAVRALNADPCGMLRTSLATGPRRTMGAASILSVVQLAASVTLSVGALLAIVSARNLSNVALGFDPADVWTCRLTWSAPSNASRRAEEMHHLVEHLSRLPGVAHVAVADRAPFVSPPQRTLLRSDARTSGEEALRPLVVRLMTPGYFEAMQIPVYHGRTFRSEELVAGTDASRSVVVITEELARRLFGTTEAVGRSIEPVVSGDERLRFEVIGIVGDSRFESLRGELEPIIYEPFGLGGRVSATGTLVVRTAREVHLARAIPAAGARLDNSVVFGPVVAVNNAIRRERAELDVLARLIVALAAVAAVIATVGLHAVIALAVVARRREYGIRLALGATPTQIVKLVMRRTTTIAAAGLVLGALGAFAFSQGLRSRLVGVAPLDPAAWLLSCSALVVIALVASALPIRRALRVDPAKSLTAL